MGKIVNRYLPHGLMIFAVIVFMCILARFISFSTAFLDPIGQTLGNFQITDTYFQMENSNADKVMDYNPDVILFDISGCYSRMDIATGVQRLHDMGAKVIALDVIFGGQSQDSIGSDSLLHVVGRCPNVIAACRMVPYFDTFRKEQSFFVPQTNCVEACVNVETDVVRHFNKSLCFGDTCLSTFVHEIIRMGYPEKFDMWEARTNEEDLVHYRQTSFDKIHIYDDFIEDDIKGKVVLVGDFVDLRDFHNIPVVIDGSRRIAGTTIHGYSISTITKGDRLITEMSTPVSLIMGIIVTILFCMLCSWIVDTHGEITGFLAMSYQLIVILFLLFFAGYLFIEHQYNVGLLYVLLGTGLAGFCAELFYYFYHKWVRWRKKKIENQA